MGASSRPIFDQPESDDEELQREDYSLLAGPDRRRWEEEHPPQVIPTPPELGLDLLWYGALHALEDLLRYDSKKPILKPATRELLSQAVRAIDAEFCNAPF